MEKWEILIGSTIGSTIFLVIGIYLDLTVFGPLIDSEKGKKESLKIKKK